ncbi:HlyD family efflux transporter periplasmic adaptor subunit [Schlesneria paludicola]|uniref:HlyD family efflux transporter periplasmic adaptor subunit n=1 Tax=Schlesneria paludicola TaxID=360056 RepID=UPI00029AC7A7|nr:HlyD family efflux transporter periplasmic adaptor subunit [Schlesneria paludicola]
MSRGEGEPNEGPLNAAEFLCRIINEIGSNIGAIWVERQGVLNPVLTIGLDDCQLFEGVEGKKFLQQILADTLRQGRAQTFDTEGLIEPKSFGHATLFVVPLLIPNASPGVILVGERPNLPQQQRLGVMRHIDMRCRELARQFARAATPPADLGFEPDSPDAPSSASPPTLDLTEVPTLEALLPEAQPDLGRVALAAEPSLSMPHQPTAASQIALASAVAPSSPRAGMNSRAVLDFLLSIQRSLDLNEVANVAVNDGRILFGVDRVSLALNRGRMAVIKAVSGQESVHPRGNLIRTLRTLTRKVISAGEPFRYDGTLNAVPKELEEPLAEFIQESGARFLLIVPLLQPERLVKPDEASESARSTQRPRKTIGALIIERMSSSEPTPELKSTLDSVTDHIAAATFNARSHSSIFLLPLWRTLGGFFEWLRGRRLAIAIVSLIALAGAGAAMVLVPWEYRVDAKGQLMPIIQREVFAPWDGIVMELLVGDDERVVEGQPLLQLRNDELEAEIVKTKSEVEEKQKFLITLKAQYDDADKNNKTEEKLRMKGKSVETQVELEGARLQYEILKKRRDRLTVRAPIAGVVTTFQLKQLLQNRPVKRGDVLLEVMDETGDWQLELEIAEHRVGRILKAQQVLSPNLDIEYRLLTSPEQSYEAKLKSLSTRTVTAESDGSVLEARAALDTSKLPACTIGAQVRARIGCGQSYLGDVLFGDVIEFIQKYCWW